MNPVEEDDEAIERVIRSGPTGALAVAGCAVVIVFMLWFAFYFVVFLPRGVIQ